MPPDKQSILIVDDQPTNIEVLNSILGNDYDILFATNGNDAIIVARNQAPDLILLDVVMPGMDGYEECRRPKNDEKPRDIPVIFSTSMDQEEDESKGLNIGAIDYVTKPLRASIVKARIHNHLQHKRYRDSLKMLSAIDGLTEIPNRRRFDETLESEWKRARRSQFTLSLLILDIDFFKAYNDHYGHLAGDNCLRMVAHGLASVVRRPADLAARFGGEEFVLLLPETDGEGAMRMATRVQEKIRLLGIPHEYSRVSKYVTLSIGAATIIPKDIEMPSDLIKAADAMLYEAKYYGRNQIKLRTNTDQILCKLVL
jgi:diguanylate cyclase (GGDEF)-like protein